MALTYEHMDAFADKHFRPVLVNNIFTGHPFLTKVLAQNKVVIKGGKAILQPILIGKHNSGAYSGMGPFNVQPASTTTLAEFPWRKRYANVTITGDDLDDANDDDGRLDLLKTNLEGAEMTLKDDLAGDLFGDGTGTDNKEFMGLEAAIDSENSYGGISVSDAPTWKSPEDSTGGSVTISWVKEMIGQATYGVESPDLILTTQTIYDALWDQAQSTQRGLMDKTVLAKLGFTGIQIDNTQILVDRHCPAGMLYGITSKYWNFYIHPNKMFKWSEPKTPVDADAYIRQIMVRGNYVCSCRRQQFKMSGLTA